jgi:hypothetical protein
VLADRSNHTFSAVIQARARSFVLLDPVDKAHRLAGWAGVIAGLAREGSPISRVQWMERTAPDDPDALSRYLREAIDPSIGLDALPLQSYLRLTHAAAPVTEQHELYVEPVPPLKAMPPSGSPRPPTSTTDIRRRRRPGWHRAGTGSWPR